MREKKHSTGNFFLKILTFCGIFVFVLFVIFSLYQAFIYSHEDEIDFSDENFNNKNKLIYIEDFDGNAFGSTGVNNSTISREILKSPIAFIYRPEFFLWNKNIAFSAAVRSNFDLDVSMQCEDCEKSSNKKLYDASYNNYIQAANFDEINVYSKSENNFKEGKNIQSWLLANVPEGSSLDLSDIDLDIKFLLNKPIKYEQSSAEYPISFSGSQTLYLNPGKKFLADFKLSHIQEVNFDDYLRVEMFNMSDKKVFDENLKIPLSGSKNYRLDIDLDKPDFYKLVLSNNFDNIKLDDFKTNANKVVFEKKIILTKPQELFFRITDAKKIYVSGDGSLSVTILDEDKQIVDSFELSDGVKELEMEQGGYYLSYAGEGLLELSGTNISYSSDHYFSPFIFDILPNEEASFRLSKNIMNKESDWNIVTSVFEKSEIRKIKDKENIKFYFSIPKFDKELKILENFIKQGFREIGGVQNYIVWGSKDSTLEQADLDTGDLNELLATYFIDSNILGDKDLAISPDFPENFMSRKTIINKYLRGEHTFNLFLNDFFDAQILIDNLNWYKGSDDINVLLLNNNSDEVVCSTLIPDDGNKKSNGIEKSVFVDFKCADLDPGVYTLYFDEPSKNSDFVINTLAVNTNKIIVKDSVTSEVDNSLYLENDEEKELGFYYWNEGLNPSVSIISDDGSFNEFLSSEDLELGKKVTYSLQEGLWQITTGNNLQISGDYFAFNKENWFEPDDFSIDYFFTRIRNENENPWINYVKLTVE